MNLRNELGIQTLQVVLQRMGYGSKKDLDVMQKLACKNIKWAANDMWQFVNGWYDEREQSYREVFLEANKLFETVYKCMLTDIYDEGCVSFGPDVKKYLNHIKFCGKKFLEPVTFYYVVKLLEEALPEIEATQEEKGSVLQQLKELKTKVYDVHNN